MGNLIIDLKKKGIVGLVKHFPSLKKLLNGQVVLSS